MRFMKKIYGNQSANKTFGCTCMLHSLLTLCYNYHILLTIMQGEYATEHCERSQSSFQLRILKLVRYYPVIILFSVLCIVIQFSFAYIWFIFRLNPLYRLFLDLEIFLLLKYILRLHDDIYANGNFLPSIVLFKIYFKSCDKLLTQKFLKRIDFESKDISFDRNNKLNVY